MRLRGNKLLALADNCAWERAAENGVGALWHDTNKQQQFRSHTARPRRSAPSKIRSLVDATHANGAPCSSRLPHAANASICVRLYAPATSSQNGPRDTFSIRLCFTFSTRFPCLGAAPQPFDWLVEVY